MKEGGVFIGRTSGKGEYPGSRRDGGGEGHLLRGEVPDPQGDRDGSGEDRSLVKSAPVDPEAFGFKLRNHPVENVPGLARIDGNCGVGAREAGHLFEMVPGDQLFFPVPSDQERDRIP